MSYVPVVITPPNPPPSPRVRELSLELSRVIEDYSRRYPDLSSREVAQATRLAAQQHGPGAAANQAVAVALGVAALLGALMLFLVRGGAESNILMWITGLAVVAAGVALAVFWRRGE